MKQPWGRGGLPSAFGMTLNLAIKRCQVFVKFFYKTEKDLISSYRKFKIRN
jgi:hypothetical protein